MNLKKVDSLFYHQFLDSFPLIIEDDTIKIKESRWISHLFFEFEEQENFVFYSVVSVNQESRSNNLYFITADKETLKPISAVYVASESNSSSGWYFYESQINRISSTKFLVEMVEHTDETASEHPPEDAFNGWIITTKNTEISINAQGRFERANVDSKRELNPY
ncbi:hypothetical protein GYB29_13150 [bacterium]|nr:hypothetical protein [bacterium]